MADILMVSSVGSVVFSLVALAIITTGVVLLLRYYLPLRTTPSYLLVPIFLAISLPASIVLLVPIDLASSARDDHGNRGIWLPQGVLLVAWRICYWLTFCLSWFVLPVLGEYADAGHREAQDKLAFSLKANAKYYAIYLLAGISGIIYFFLSFGASPTSLKGVLMALAYCWGLVLAIYLMGHGLVAIPRSCFKKYSVAGRLRNIESRASRLHEKMEDAIQDLEHLEAQVAELAKRTTGSVANFRDWIADLVDDARLSESTQLLSTRQGSVPGGSVPRIITEGYLADLSRQLCRARHSRARYVDEWEHLLYEHVYYETILKSTDTKTITLGRASPHSSFLDRFTVHTPYSRYLWRYWVVPYLWLALGAFLSLCSFCIVWSEIIKTVNPYMSLISLTVVHHPDSSAGQVGLLGQFMAACWILYMCTAALRTLVEVKVWRGRALVRRNTHGESASWYAMQLVKLSVPLSFNFLTFLPPQLYEDTVFYNFLGRLINLTPLGESFDLLFPTVILLPVCATLFNLYGHVQNWLGYDRIIVDEQDDIEDGILMATSSCRAGRELIHRELSAQSVPEIGGSTASRNSEDFNDSDPLRLSIPAARHSPIAGPLRTSPVARSQRPVLEPEEEEEEETFFEALAHRMKNTLDTAEPPQWLQGIKRPRWMGGDDSPAPSPSANGPDLGRWFGGRPDGRVRL